MSDRVVVSALDPVTGETSSKELDPYGYVLIVGEHMEVTSLNRYANGTVQFTIKRADSE